MKAIAAVMAMKYMYGLRKALKRNDHADILRNHALYEEWQVRPEEVPTGRYAKATVDALIDSVR